jgi:hypothetical protein
MGVGAGKPLPARDVEALIARLEGAAEQEACWSCERLQGFITQLEMDAAADGRVLLEMYEVRQEKLHGCLGCQPCPPGDLFAAYQARR